MKAPTFWQRRYSPLSLALSPFGLIYHAVAKSCIDRPAQHESRLPVICVGNATMGGSGKTPVVHAIVKLLQEMEQNPAILLRGYGGTTRGPVYVTKDRPAHAVGDEALLHADVADTYISVDRVKGAQLIEQDNSITQIVMDDGLQNPSLNKTCNILVIDGQNPFGNGRYFPAGPLRESMADAVDRAQAVVIIGDDKQNLGIQYRFLRPVFHAKLRSENKTQFAGQPVIAFAGIGRPQKFFQSLRDADAVIAETYEFPDHHRYYRYELAKLLDRAQRAHARLVTTRKDWVRLPADFRSFVDVLDVSLVWDDATAVKTFLQSLTSMDVMLLMEAHRYHSPTAQPILQGDAA